MAYRNRRKFNSKDQYIRPEDEIRTEEGFTNQYDPERTGFVPAEQKYNPNREEEFYDRIDRKSHPSQELTVEELAGQELADTLMAMQDEWTIYEYIQDHPEMRGYLQHNYPEFFDADGEEKDPMDYYRKHYPEYFPGEEHQPKKIKKDEGTDTPLLKYAEVKKPKKSNYYILGKNQTQKIFFTKGTPDKDWRHGVDATGRKEWKINENRKHRRKTKEELRRLLAA